MRTKLNKKQIIKNKLLIICTAILLLAGVFVFSVANANVVSAQVSYCCEKTTDGAWCQNSAQEACDSEFRSVPTSCEATSYCKLGTCINTQEGTCIENTPQRRCTDESGFWKAGSPDEIPQCSLGCCLMGDQAAFVTQTRCKRLSSLYGLETNFRTDLTNEIECIASATSDVRGACVFSKEFERTCSMTTKKECQDLEGGEEGLENSEEEVVFHEGFLCSDETLATNCGPSEQTTCVEGKDEVYFLDTCGNLANIYDSSKKDGGPDDIDYWSQIKGKSESCVLTETNSRNCGNCDYFSNQGSTCKSAKRGDNPVYGDNICRNLKCQDEDFFSAYGRDPRHGETWCAGTGVSQINIDSQNQISASGEDLPGARYFRKVCYNSEVTVEPCAEFRQEVCIQSGIDIGNDQTFKTAGCRVNRWQDCALQNESEGCSNTDKRDCEWMPVEERTFYELDSGGLSSVFSKSYTEKTEVIERCVPKYAPGFDFWNAESDAGSICSLASTECTVTTREDIFGKGEGETILGKEVPTDNIECQDSGWEDKISKSCLPIGDCGDKVNFLNK